MDEQEQVAFWLSNSMPIIRIVLFSIIAVCAIIMIVAILFQSEDAGSTEAITGTRDSYYSQNRGGSRDGKLKLITIIMGCIIFVCAVLYLVSNLLYSGT